MLKRLTLSAALLIALTGAVFGQAVQQSGAVSPNTAAIWNGTGVVKGGVTAADSPLTSFGVTREAVDAFCVSSARASAVARNQLCFQASTAGPAKITLQNYGTASPQNLQFVLNGVPLTLPSGGGTFVTASGPFTTGNVANFLNNSGVLQDSGLGVSAGSVTTGNWAATPVPLLFGGTGSTTASGARTALGLGTIATQNAATVAISGGAITGMPSPSGSSDVATKGYVDGIASGLTILAPSNLATTAVLPNTPTYANGASGVGATLTAASNTTLTVDGTAAPLATVVLVKNQASALQNGIYTVTQAGSGAVPWILTRATYFDQAAEMKAGSYTFINGGATLVNSSYTLQATVATVGTDSLTFVLFSQVSAGVTSIAGNAGAFLLGSGLNNSGNTLLNNGVLSVAGNNGAFTLNGASGLTNSTNDIQCSQGSSAQFGCVKVNNTTITAAAGVIGLNLNSQVLQASPADPTGTASVSPGVMMGLGATCKLTPTYSTRVRLQFQGFLSSTGSGVTIGVQARYGTGGNPGNGATVTGGMIALGSSPQAAMQPANYIVPFTVGGIITGLTPGTAYWFDISIYGLSGTTTAKQISCDAHEVM